MNRRMNGRTELSKAGERVTAWIGLISISGIVILFRFVDWLFETWVLWNVPPHSEKRLEAALLIEQQKRATQAAVERREEMRRRVRG